MKSLASKLFLLALAVATTSFGSDAVPHALLGPWVQEGLGPVATYQRRYVFNADGSYEYAFTMRNTGATTEQTLAREEGRLTVQGDQLTLSPTSGPSRRLPWRVERDPYVGDERLVLPLPDGTLDIYFRP